MASLSLLFADGSTAGAGASGEKPKTTPKYDKSKSFFDEISTDRDQRNTRTEGDRTNVNSETFGESLTEPASLHTLDASRWPLFHSNCFTPLLCLFSGDSAHHYRPQGFRNYRGGRRGGGGGGGGGGGASCLCLLCVHPGSTAHLPACLVAFASAGYGGGGRGRRGGGGGGGGGSSSGGWRRGGGTSDR
jgi:hypothetical protein